MAKAKHVRGWRAGSSEQLPGPRATLLFWRHTAVHCSHCSSLLTLFHCTAASTACALVRTLPHFCRQTAYSFPSGAEGNLRGAIRCEQEPPKCAKKYFQVKWSNIKKLCHVLALNYLSFWGVTIILCWLKEGGIEYGGMIGWTSLGLSITSPRVSPELLQTHFFLQYDQ